MRLAGIRVCQGGTSVSKVAVYVGEQKLFASDGDASTIFDGSAIEVCKEVDDDLETIFIYVFRPGQYAKVTTADGVETVRIDE